MNEWAFLSDRTVHVNTIEDKDGESLFIERRYKTEELLGKFSTLNSLMRYVEQNGMILHGLEDGFEPAVKTAK